MKRRYFLIMTGIILFAISNWSNLFLRFNNKLANDLFVLLIFVLFTILLIQGMIKLNSIKSKFTSIAITIVLTPLWLLFSLLILMFTILKLEDIFHEKDDGFERIHQIQNDIYVYRIDGGATTAHGIVVRQERVLLPGILLVKELFKQYPLDDLAYKKHQNQLVLINPYSHAVLGKVDLKPYLYF